MKKKKTFVLIVIFLAFIALGLPDALLGSAWNLIRVDLHVNLSALGLTTIVVYLMSIFSTFNAPNLLRRFQTEHIVFVSILMTGASLLAISQVNHYYMMVFFAVPLGLGAGAIDVSLNHYLASQYQAKHMNYLHSFYGIGVLSGPTIMAYFLRDELWRIGYITVAIILFVIAFMVLFSVRLWKKESLEERMNAHEKMPLAKTLKVPGAKSSILAFLFYVHVESLGGVWIASYYYLTENISYAEAAFFASMFYIAFTLGRFLSALLSRRFSPQQLIMIGQSFVILSVVLMLFKTSAVVNYVIVFLFGLGCAPIFPGLMYLNKSVFKPQQISSMMALQMGIGYLGFGLLTPLAGFIFDQYTIKIYPLFILLAVLIVIITTRSFFKQSVLVTAVSQNDNI